MTFRHGDAVKGPTISGYLGYLTISCIPLQMFHMHVSPYLHPSFPHTHASMQAWNEPALLRPEPAYVPRLRLDSRVMRVPIVPGLDPRK